MSDHAFLAAMLRFVADKTEAAAMDDPRTAAMMAGLRKAADEAETGSGLRVADQSLELTARAFAGFAGFLQKQILPEVVAHGNAVGEAQIRWSIDTAMAAVSTLLARAALPERGDVTIDLPPPP
ncbi:hypothetical protein CU669_10470 [Paramagnetospirillum kuznetsovii]|uniref:Uncharacterized protein n=1 Tax=Paramagnetospirillum kuznetsovii TaxID=2053833 RepID=A0A364NYD5_9PROT|nr:hypothetical protein [Paramagnetospirillum kuznetsovii]RAU22094.1 hypothetical protein CU669_10470 [Paramagnetospirillum kuznetsovii]